MDVEELDNDRNIYVFWLRTIGLQDRHFWPFGFPNYISDKYVNIFCV